MERIRVKRCYENAYHLATSFVEGIAAEDLEVMFCYVASNAMGGLYFRHAFLLVNGKIVEPLPNVREDADFDKVVPFARLSQSEYISLILKGRMYDCVDVLLDQEIETLTKSRILLNPVEASDLAFRFAKTPDDFLKILQKMAKGDYSSLKTNNHPL